MAKIFYTDLNLNGNQLLNAVMHNVTSFSDNTLTSPKVGQICYLTAEITYDSETCQPGLYQYKQITESTYKWVLVGNNLNDLTATDTDVVTGSRHINNSTSELQTVAFGSMKPGQATSHLYDGDNSDASTTLARSLQGFDDTVGKMRHDYLQRATKEGGHENEILLNGTNGYAAELSGIYLQSTGNLNPTSNTEVPTSEKIAQYVGSFAGGIHYKGTVDANRTGADTDTEKKNLPTTGVITGDLWIVKSDGEYGPDDKKVQAYKGDFFIASVNSVDGKISWQHIPIDFTVINKAANVVAGGGKTTIATIDGTDITLQNIVTAGTATIATVDDNDVVTLHGGLQQIGTTGTIASNADADVITLAKVAKTGQAVDVIVPENSGLQGANVLNTLQSLQGTIEHLDVEGFQQVTFANDNKAVTFYGLQEIDGVISKSANDKNFTLAFQSVYNETTNPIALQSTVENAIDSLDVASNTVGETNVHVTYKEVDGIVTVESVSEDYATVGTSKSDNEDTIVTIASGDNGKLTKASDFLTLQGFVNTRIAEEVDKLDVDGFVQAEYATDGDITIGGIKEENGKISRDNSGSLQATIPVNHAYTNADANKTDIATVYTVTTGLQTLDVDEYAQASVTSASTASTVGGTFKVESIKEVDGKISKGNTPFTLTAERGLNFYSNNGTNAIGHTNVVMPPTTSLGSVGTGSDTTAPVTKVLTGVTYDTNGHFTAASETALTDVNIPVNGGIRNLDAKDVHSALAELQGDIDSCISGTQFKGDFNDTDKPFPLTGKKGDQWIYNGTNPTTLFEKKVEKGDMVIVSNVTNEDEVTKIGTISAVVVIERSLDKAVTNTSDALTTNMIVLGAGNDTVKTSTYGVSTTGLEATVEGVDTNILTEKATVTTIVNHINALDVDGYFQGNISSSGNTSTITLFGIKEVDGKIDHDSDKDASIYVDGVYNGTSSTNHNYLATESTVKNAIDALDNDGEIISSVANGVVTLYKTITETDGIIGISDDDSNKITFAKVAITGKAEDVSIADIGNYFTATNVEAALAELASGANAVKMWSVASPAITAGTAWTINISTTESGWSALTNATVSVRASNGEEVECDKVLTGTTVKLTFSESFNAGAFTAVVTTKGGLVTAVANNA